MSPFKFYLLLIQKQYQNKSHTLLYGGNFQFCYYFSFLIRCLIWLCVYQCCQSHGCGILPGAVVISGLEILDLDVGSWILVFCKSGFTINYGGILLAGKQNGLNYKCLSVCKDILIIINNDVDPSYLSNMWLIYGMQIFVTM